LDAINDDSLTLQSSCATIAFEYFERGEYMSNKQRGLLAIFILIAATIMISACTYSLSTPPAATPTLLPDNLFVSPIASVENPMAMIEEFAKQTSVAQTTVANGGTPVTPQAIVVGTVITPQAGTAVTPQAGTVVAPAGAPGTPTNAIAGPATPAIVTAAPATTAPATPKASNTTPVPPGVRPGSYTLQNGEFPYCIARRFNVDPDALMSMNGLTDADVYYAGKTLTIPQSGAFPGGRMLATHPTTYSVLSGEETIYSVACKFGDIDPATIASANSISVSAKLTAGQKLQIP
jgi:LysM repeat protein